MCDKQVTLNNKPVRFHASDASLICNLAQFSSQLAIRWKFENLQLQQDIHRKLITLATFPSGYNRKNPQAHP